MFLLLIHHIEKESQAGFHHDVENTKCDPLTTCHGMELKSTPLFMSPLRALQRQQAEDQVETFVKIMLHDSDFRLTVTASVSK